MYNTPACAPALLPLNQQKTLLNNIAATTNAIFEQLSNPTPNNTQPANFIQLVTTLAEAHYVLSTYHQLQPNASPVQQTQYTHFKAVNANLTSLIQALFESEEKEACPEAFISEKIKTTAELLTQSAINFNAPNIAYTPRPPDRTLLPKTDHKEPSMLKTVLCKNQALSILHELVEAANDKYTQPTDQNSVWTHIAYYNNETSDKPCCVKAVYELACNQHCKII